MSHRYKTPPPPHDIRAHLTCSFIHRELIGQDPANLAKGGHLDSILLQLALHVVDLLLWEHKGRTEGRDPLIEMKKRKTEGSRSRSGVGVGWGNERRWRQTVPGSCVIIRFLTLGAEQDLRWQEKLPQLLITFTFPEAATLLWSLSTNRLPTNLAHFKLLVNLADRVTLVMPWI